MSELIVKTYTFDKISTLDDYRHAGAKGDTSAVCGKHISTDIFWTLVNRPQMCPRCVRVLAERASE